MMNQAVQAQHEGRSKRHHHALTNQSMHTDCCFCLGFQFGQFYLFFEPLKEIHSQKFPSVYVECTFISMNILTLSQRRDHIPTTFLGVGTKFTKSSL